MGVGDEDVALLAVLPDDGAREGARLVDAGGEERLVTGAVEDRARVVAHAAVDRQVGADAGDLLDRPDPVERDGRGGPAIERPGSTPSRGHRRETGVGRGPLERAVQRLRVVGDFEHRVVGEVAGAEPAAEVQLVDRLAGRARAISAASRRRSRPPRRSESSR